MHTAQLTHGCRHTTGLLSAQDGLLNMLQDESKQNQHPVSADARLFRSAQNSHPTLHSHILQASHGRHLQEERRSTHLVFRIGIALRVTVDVRPVEPKCHHNDD